MGSLRSALRDRAKRTYLLPGGRIVIEERRRAGIALAHDAWERPAHSSSTTWRSLEISIRRSPFQSELGRYHQDWRGPGTGPFPRS